MSQPLTSKIHEFFARNPDEELSYQDLQVKFDLTQRQAHDAIQRLKSQGLIESVQVIRLPRGN